VPEDEEGAVAAPMSNTFTTTDPELAHAMMCAAYTDNRLRVSGDTTDFQLRHTRWELGRVAVDELSNTLIVDMDVRPANAVWVTRVVRSTMEVEVDRVTRCYGPGDVFVGAPPAAHHHTRFRGCAVVTIGFGENVFSEVTGEETFDPMSRLRLDPMPTGRARAWRQTVDFVTRTVLNNGDAAANPLIVGTAQRLLAVTALHGYGIEPAEKAGTRRDATPASVRRAVAFIEANPDLDISVADIARAAHVSVRALQLAFRRHLDTTPLRYLRRVRLDLAHADLQAARPDDGTTVTDVALHWGCADLSRFAADYRAVYAEHPHMTLRRGT
jgi:AraC-like DNA-binding protein